MGTPFSGNPYGQGRQQFTFGAAGPLPTGIKALIIANVAVFMLQYVFGGRMVDLFGLTSSDVVPGLRVWQLVTYLFLHGTTNIFHIVFNMLLLWMFGTELERRWGTQAFLQFYLICGVGAGLTNVVVDWLAEAFMARHAFIPTIGASGAVYGLLAAQAILFPGRMLLLFLIFPMKMRAAVLLMAAMMLFTAFGSPGSTVNHVAHLGGMLFAWIYLHRAWNPLRIWREWRWKMKRRKYRVVTDIKDDDRHRFH